MVQLSPEIWHFEDFLDHVTWCQMTGILTGSNWFSDVYWGSLHSGETSLQYQPVIYITSIIWDGLLNVPFPIQWVQGSQKFWRNASDI